MNELNESIKHIPIPRHMRNLPISDQGFLIPWFVAHLEDGTPVPHLADPVKRLRAGRIGLCWCCGDWLGVHKSFVIGPMCSVTRTTSEPPNHLGCAEYAVQVCPYLRNPRMRRNPIDVGGTLSVPGLMIDRNPKVSLIWTTRHYRAFPDHQGGVLYSIGDPESLAYYSEGRKATRAEVMESIETGIPRLHEIAKRDGSKAVEQLNKQYAQALRYVPQD